MNQAKRFTGACDVWVLHDQNAGRRDVYTVLVMTSDDPVTVGREVPIDLALELVSEYQEQARQAAYMGDRTTALEMRRCIARKRLLTARDASRALKRGMR